MVLLQKGMIFRGRRRAGRRKCRFRGFSKNNEFGLTLCGNLRGLREDPSKRNDFVAGAGNSAKSADFVARGAALPSQQEYKVWIVAAWEPSWSSGGSFKKK